MSTPKKYRKRPVVIEAVQWTGDNLRECFLFCETIILNHFPNPEILMIPTMEGNIACLKGDWIIRDVHGDFYPCRTNMFEIMYEEIKL